MPARLESPFRCSRCGILLTPENSIKNRKAKSGLHSNCKDCRRVTKRSYHQRVAEHLRFKHKRNTYGVDERTFDSLFYEQAGRCKLCAVPFARLRDVCIDHCHKTGAVRGLLCSPCNTALGRYERAKEMNPDADFDAYLDAPMVLQVPAIALAITLRGGASHLLLP